MSKSYLRKNRIAGQFAPRTIAMLESPAFQVLSLAGHRVLARIEIELAHHGGNDNGRLPVTFDHFAEYGMDRHAIAPALREVCALGFIEITEQGRAGNAEWRRPNKFRLTYRHTGRADQTDEWRRITTQDYNRGGGHNDRTEGSRFTPKEKQNSSGGFRQFSVWKPPPKTRFSWWENPHYGPWCENPHYL